MSKDLQIQRNECMRRWRRRLGTDRGQGGLDCDIRPQKMTWVCIAASPTEVALLEPLVVGGCSGSRDETSDPRRAREDRTRRTIAASGEKRCSPKTRCEGQECSAGSHFGRVGWLFGSQTCRIRSAWLAKGKSGSHRRIAVSRDIWESGTSSSL